MDVALKQRLVGASVLVIFAVTFIPMLLDGPPSSPIEAPIAIPEPPDSRFETRLLPVDPDAAATQRPAAQSVPETAASSAPVRPAVTRSRTADTTTTAEAPARTTSPAPSPAGETAEEPASDSAGSAVPAVGGDWVLQVGSFGNAANAARLVSRLQEASWQAYQEKVEMGSNALYRVRVGAWPDRDRALDAGEGLLKAFPELELSVRQRQGAAPPMPAAQARLKGWMVQMGSFNSRNNAMALRDKLRGGGYSAHLSDAGAGASARYRVRVGPELDEDAARATRERLREQFGLSGMVVDHP
ncbi:MAG: SPOR domain-containing protein [Pseudomonadota bacterium]